jgi:hypothetical protein
MTNGNHYTRAQQAAMFFAGITAWETLGHWWLGTWGQELLPFRVGGFEFTATHNYVMMVVWPALTFVLAWYAWFKPARIPAL